MKARRLPSQRTLLLGFFLVAATLAAYWPTLRAGFIWDDDNILTQNLLIKAADGLRRFWFTRQAPDYWPVTSTSLWIEWRLWGLHAAGYHAVNLALHASEVLLLWAIFARLRLPGAFLAALLFAVHPLNVESVAWIAQRKNLLAMLFYLLSILFYLKGEEGRGRFWRGFSLAAFTLGMLSKGSVAMLPLVLLGIIVWRRKPTAADWSALLPFALVAVLFTGIDVWFQGHGTGQVIRHAGPIERLLGAGGTIWFYLSKALLPADLIFIYPQWRIRVDDPVWWAGPVAAIAVTWVLGRFRAGWGRALLFAWLYFCAMLVPVMGFADIYYMKYSLVADHYAHLALIGVVALAAAAWTRWSESVHGSLLGFGLLHFAAAAVVGTCVLFTWQRCETYREAQTLYEATVRDDPSSWMGHFLLANVLAAEPGREADAIAQYRTALKLNPGYADADTNLANLLAAQPGGQADAGARYQAALRLNPNSAVAHNNYAAYLAGQPGRQTDAMAEYETALRIQPDYADAQLNLANLLAAQPDRQAEAILHYEAALKLKPEFAASAELQYDLANLLAGSPDGQAEAVSRYQQAIRLSPNMAVAHNNLAILLTQMPGRELDALAHFEAAARANPDFAEAHYNAAVACANLGRLEDAARHLREVLRIDPNDARARDDLAKLTLALQK